MARHRSDTSSIWISGLTWLLAGVLALALVFGLSVARPSGALADGDTNCDQADLQTALTAGQTLITVAPGCTISMASPLVVGNGVNITIDGNGLVLNGTYFLSDVIDINDVSAASTLSLNQVTVEHGETGIYDHGDRATVNLTASTISGNRGGVSAHNVTATNSTIAGNDFDGIDADVATLTSSTIIGNGNTGLFIIDSITLEASVIANNEGGNCNFDGVTVTDNGHNLSASDGGSDTSCDFTGTSKNSVPLTGTDGLNLVNDGALGNYGGLTPTIALGAGSVAIDAIPNADCPTATDQRGVTRPQGSGCDVGAYEAISGPYTVTHSTCPTQQDLQDGFDLAGVMKGNLLTIDITKAGCTIDLTGTLEVGTGVNITINGDGLTLDGHGHDVIGINDAAAASTLSLNQMTVENGDSGIYDHGDHATVNLTASTVSGNDANGISAHNVILTDSTIAGNYDGGVFTDTVTATASTIANNGAFGLFPNDSITLTASLLSHNAAGNCILAEGPANSNSYSLSDDKSCGFSGTSQDSITGLNLLPLGNYGGPTPTIALGPGSVAIDAIPSADCGEIIDPTTTNPIATDQRGISRKQGSGCDVGAYEAPSLHVSLSDQLHNGWYAMSQPVSLTYGGLAPSQTVSCGDSPALAGFAVTATQLGQQGMLSPAIVDGSYALNCGLSQDAISLGVSYSGPTQPVDLKIDTVAPIATITSPTNDAVFLVGSSADAAFSCADPNAPSGATGSGLASTNGCVGTLDGTTITSGTILDTSSSAIGTHTLQVIATDQAGNSGSHAVTYQLEALNPPTISVNGGASYTNASYWYNLGNSANGVTLTVSDTNSLVTGYTCTNNGSPLSLTLAGDTPPSGHVALNEGIHHLSCTASASSTSISSSATTATVQVDRTRPAISSPSPNARYVLNAASPLTCVDPPGADNATGSGIASCQMTVTLPDGATQTVTRPDDLPTGELGRYTIQATNVADVAGNTASQTVAYTVGYTTPALPGNTTTVKQGYYAVIRFAPEDANGHDYASRKLKVASVELDGDGQTIAFAHAFQFGTFSGTKGYQLSINTRNLTSGTWTLLVTIGSDKMPYTIVFTVR